MHLDLIKDVESPCRILFGFLLLYSFKAKRFILYLNDIPVLVMEMSVLGNDHPHSHPCVAACVWRIKFVCWMILKPMCTRGIVKQNKLFFF